jgi:hypothetical protein
LARRRRKRGAKARLAPEAAPAAPETETQRLARIRRRRLATEAAAPKGQPTPEQQQRNSYALKRVKEPGRAQASYRLHNITQGAIDRYFARGILDARQFAAVDRYRSDYERCGIAQRITAGYDFSGAGGRATSPSYIGTLPATEAQAMARQRFRAARDAVPMTLRDRFDRIVIDNQEPAAIGAEDGHKGARASGWGIFVVRLGADELIAHYRIPANDGSVIACVDKC